MRARNSKYQICNLQYRQNLTKALNFIYRGNFTISYLLLHPQVLEIRGLEQRHRITIIFPASDQSDQVFGQNLVTLPLIHSWTYQTCERLWEALHTYFTAMIKFFWSQINNFWWKKGTKGTLTKQNI